MRVRFATKRLLVPWIEMVQQMIGIPTPEQQRARDEAFTRALGVPAIIYDGAAEPAGITRATLQDAIRVPQMIAQAHERLRIEQASRERPPSL